MSNYTSYELAKAIVYFIFIYFYIAVLSWAFVTSLYLVKIGLELLLIADLSQHNQIRAFIIFVSGCLISWFSSRQYWKYVRSDTR
jgi:hypothetical protein